jgi:hypothetical protein
VSLPEGGRAAGHARFGIELHQVGDRLHCRKACDTLPVSLWVGIGNPCFPIPTQSAARMLADPLGGETVGPQGHGFDGERHIAMPSDDNHGFPLRLKM